MGYELGEIENKIAEKISFAASEALDFSVPEFLNQLDRECQKVKQAFKHQIVSFENEALVSRYFHFHQESLVELINTLHVRTEGPGSCFLRSILDRLCELLTYVEEHFPDYFNQDMKMPSIYRETVKEEIESFLLLMSDKFDNSSADIGLVELIKNSLIMCLDFKRGISFRQFYYLKVLRLNVEAMDSSNYAGFETLDLIRLLMHCNFNTESFYNYTLRYVRWSVDKAQTVGEKLDQLTFYLKFSNQETAPTGVAFNHHEAPVNVQIADWISQEVMYLKNKQQLMTTVSAEDVLTSEFKLTFDLSVSHLAYLIRLFVESGVIQNKNVSELIRFLTKYVKTKRSESVSYESFRIKYYSVEAGTKDAVKKTLQSILTFITKN